MKPERIVRIASGQGFWGDSVDAPVRLIEEGPLDYLALLLNQEGHARVRVSGVRAAAALESYKVSISYLEGCKATGHLTVSGSDAQGKTHAMALLRLELELPDDYDPPRIGSRGAIAPDGELRARS